MVKHKEAIIRLLKEVLSEDDEDAIPLVDEIIDDIGDSIDSQNDLIDISLELDRMISEGNTLEEALGMLKAIMTTVRILGENK